MATYTIRTNRKQEIGLKFSYDTYADKAIFPTQESWLQSQVNPITNAMYADQQRANTVAFDQSFETIPETSQPAAQAEIEQVIINHGGTVIPPSGTMVVLPPPPPLATEKN